MTKRRKYWGDDRIKTAMILAAGYGTRMLGLTQKVPKPLIKVNGIPFIFYLIKQLDEANFMIAKCYYMLSPIYSLDQENTNEAMEKLQIFIDNYPKSNYLSEANSYIKELQVKLEKKDFEVSKQYYTIRDYKAAISSLDNFISNFPGTPFRENALYYKFLSQYEIATNSIPNKKLERLEGALETHNAILRYYPETLFMDDISKKLEEIQKQINTINRTNT